MGLHKHVCADIFLYKLMTIVSNQHLLIKVAIELLTGDVFFFSLCALYISNYYIQGWVLVTFKRVVSF